MTKEFLKNLEEITAQVIAIKLVAAEIIAIREGKVIEECLKELEIKLQKDWEEIKEDLLNKLPDDRDMQEMYKQRAAVSTLKYTTARLLSEDTYKSEIDCIREIELAAEKRSIDELARK